MIEAWFMLAFWIGDPKLGWPYPQAPVARYVSEAACLADAPNRLRLKEEPGRIGVVCLKGVVP